MLPGTTLEPRLGKGRSTARRSHGFGRFDALRNRDIPGTGGPRDAHAATHPPQSTAVLTVLQSCPFACLSSP